VDIFLRKVRITFENLLVRPAVCEQLHDKFDGNSRPLNDGLADEHLGINADSILPRHNTGSFLILIVTAIQKNLFSLAASSRPSFWLIRPCMSCFSLSLGRKRVKTSVKSMPRA